MSKGDKMTITTRQGTVDSVVALLVGGRVEVIDHEGRNAFIKVEELNRAGAPIRTALFAKSDVVSIVQGHDEQKRKPRK